MKNFELIDEFHLKNEKFVNYPDLPLMCYLARGSVVVPKTYIQVPAIFLAMRVCTEGHLRGAHFPPELTHEMQPVVKIWEDTPEEVEKAVQVFLIMRDAFEEIVRLGRDSSRPEHNLIMPWGVRELTTRLFASTFALVDHLGQNAQARRTQINEFCAAQESKHKPYGLTIEEHRRQVLAERQELSEQKVTAFGNTDADQKAYHRGIIEIEKKLREYESDYLWNIRPV
jgi:hypothetical protein